LKELRKMMKMPKIGILICNSGASNSGALTGMAAMEIIKKNDEVGILSLPALANEVPRQLSLIKKISYIIVIDGCNNSCAKKITEKLGISYTACFNLEKDLSIRKLGPFTTLNYSDDECNKIKGFIENIVKGIVQYE
jgi:uncharacterized metal-binding protein